MNHQFAIAGCGHIGKRHALQISRLASVSAVCDNVPQKADELAAAYGCRAFYSMDDMLGHIAETDIVSICTPNYLHEPHTIAALEKSHHVLCEKPMAISTDSCLNMISRANANKRQIFVVKQNRYNPPVQAVKQLLSKNALGRILMVTVNCFWNRDENYYRGSDWKGIRSKDGGILFTQFSHFIDVLYYLLGPVKPLAGSAKNLMHINTTDFDDNLCFILEGKDGLMISLNASTCAYGKNMEGSITILGETGSVKIGGQYMNTIEYSNIKDFILPAINIEGHNNQYGHYEGSMSNHHLVIQNVMDTLDGKASAMTSAEEGLQVVQMIEDMYNLINKH